MTTYFEESNDKENPDILMGDFESTSLKGKNVPTGFTIINTNPNKANQRYSQEYRPNPTDLFNAHAYVVQNMNLAELKSEKRISNYYGAVQRHEFLKQIEGQIFCFQNFQFDNGLENTDSVFNCLEPYMLTKKNLSLDLMDITTAVSLINPESLDLYDKSIQKYTRSLGSIIPKFFNKQQTLKG